MALNNPHILLSNEVLKKFASSSTNSIEFYLTSTRYNSLFNEVIVPFKLYF